MRLASACRSPFVNKIRCQIITPVPVDPDLVCDARVCPSGPMASHFHRSSRLLAAMCPLESGHVVFEKARVLSSMRHADVRFDDVDELICHDNNALQLEQREEWIVLVADVRQANSVRVRGVEFRQPREQGPGLVQSSRLRCSVSKRQIPVQDCSWHFYYVRTQGTVLFLRRYCSLG